MIGCPVPSRLTPASDHFGLLPCRSVERIQRLRDGLDPMIGNGVLSGSSDEGFNSGRLVDALFF